MPWFHTVIKFGVAVNAAAAANCLAKDDMFGAGLHTVCAMFGVWAIWQMRGAP